MTNANRRQNHINLMGDHDHSKFNDTIDFLLSPGAAIIGVAVWPSILIFGGLANWAIKTNSSLTLLPVAMACLFTPILPSIAATTFVRIIIDRRAPPSLLNEKCYYAAIRSCENSQAKWHFGKAYFGENEMRFISAGFSLRLNYDTIDETTIYESAVFGCTQLFFKTIVDKKNTDSQCDRWNPTRSSVPIIARNNS